MELKEQDHSKFMSLGKSMSSHDKGNEMSIINTSVNICPAVLLSTPNALYPVNPDSQTCKFSVLKVSSGKRNLNLTENKSYSERLDKNILEVVAGVTSDKKKLTIGLEGTAGPCGQHSKNIKVETPSGQVISGTTNLSHEASSIASQGYLERLWPMSMPKSTIRISAITCGHITNTRVIVYPDVSWDIIFAFKYDEKISKFKFDKFQVKHKYNGINYTLTPSELPSPIKAFLELLNKTIDVVIGIKQAYRDLTGVERDDEYGFNIAYPVIEFSGKWGWEENKETTLCKYPITIKFKLDPLVGFTYKKDILEMLISKWPGIGTAINIIRKKASDSVEFKIDLEIKGKISKSGEISFDLASEEKNVDVQGEAKIQSYSISFTLSGSASIDILTVQCGASIEGASSFSFDFVKIGADSKGPFVQFPLTWSGIEVKSLIYTGSNSQEVATGAPQNEARRRGTAKKSVKKENVLLKISEKKLFGEKIYTT
jgi:hypothetical protein